jgi:glycerophosphoryl diester phosphodiesterase
MTAPAWLTARPIAHRGLHDQPRGLVENSLAAAAAAVRRGYAIECDVQESLDGEAVVFHDFTLDRLTGQAGAVRERTAAALEQLTLSGSVERIPSLATFLDRVAGQVPVIVEIKSRFDGDLRLARRTCQVALAAPGPVALKSFDPAVVAEVRRLAPGLPRGIVAESRYEDPDWAGLKAEARERLAHLLHFDETRPDFLSWRLRDLRTAPPFLCRRLGGLPVMTWTVRDGQGREAARAWADQIVFEGFDPET